MSQAMLFLLFAILANVGAQTCIKAGLSKLALPEWEAGTWLSNFALVFSNGWVVLGLVSAIVSLGGWVVALSKMELGIAYPMISISYVFAALAGYWLFNEPLGAMKIAGIALIMLGALLLGKAA